MFLPFTPYRISHANYSGVPSGPPAAVHPQCAIPTWVSSHPSQALAMFPGSVFPCQSLSYQPPCTATQFPSHPLPYPSHSFPTHGSCRSAAVSFLTNTERLVLCSTHSCYLIPASPCGATVFVLSCTFLSLFVLSRLLEDLLEGILPVPAEYLNVMYSVGIFYVKFSAVLSHHAQDL